MFVNDGRLIYMLVNAQVKLNIPYLVDVYDYHEVDQIREYLSKFSNLKTCELQVQDEDHESGYLCLIYVGRRPSKRIIRQIYERDFQKLSKQIEIVFN